MVEKLKILHLEDLPNDAELVEWELNKSSLQFEILVVGNERDFINALTDFSPDIILSDHSLPTFSSLGALKVLRDREIKLPFILITATTSEETAVNVMKEGACDYILKDRMTRLPMAIKIAMEKFRSEKEKEKYLEQLIKNEKRFRGLTENSYDMVGLLNENYQFIYRSQSTARITGFSDKESEKQDSVDRTHPEDMERQRKVILKAYKNPGKAFLISFRTLHKNGHYIWVEGVVTNMLHDEALKGVIINFRDITETKLAQLALANSHRQLKFHLENSPLGFIEWDSQFFVTKMSKRAEEIFGWTTKEYLKLQQSGHLAIHPDDYALSEQMAKELLVGKTSRNHFQQRIVTKSGKVIWTELFNSVLKNNQGEVMTIMSLISDITNSKETELKISQSEANLISIIENTDARIYSLDAELRYLTFNSAQKNILQMIYGLEIKPGDNAYQFLEKLEPKEAESWKDIYTKALAGETMRFEKEYPVGNDSSFISFSIIPIWEHEKVIGLSCFSFDITNQKHDELQKEKMTADIIQRNNNLEQFSYIVSHNLRSPVANILGLISLLKQKNLSSEDKIYINEGLNQSAIKLDDVIKDLNTILQVKQNVTERKELVNLSQLTTDIKVSIETIITKGNVKIISDFSAVAEMMTIKSYLHSIFYNLISNSIKYGRANVTPLIEIRSQIINNNITLTFKDNGLGIDLVNQHDKVFGLYKRFHDTHAEGKGIGLYMVKTQVESIGGAISIKSEVNKGTEFTIKFSM